MIKLKRVLTYFDIPLLFIAEDEIKQEYLCEIISDEDELEYWCTPISIIELEFLEQGFTSLKDIFLSHKNSIYHCVISDYNQFTNRIVKISSRQINPDWIPGDDSFLVQRPKYECKTTIKDNSNYSYTFFSEFKNELTHQLLREEIKTLSFLLVYHQQHSDVAGLMHACFSSKETSCRYKSSKNDSRLVLASPFVSTVEHFPRTQDRNWMDYSQYLTSDKVKEDRLLNVSPQIDKELCNETR